MTLKRYAVLQDLKIEKNGISIEELPFVGKINLRGNANLFILCLLLVLIS